MTRGGAVWTARGPWRESEAELGGLEGKKADVYRHMTVDQIPEFTDVAATVGA